MSNPMQMLPADPIQEFLGALEEVRHGFEARAAEADDAAEAEAVRQLVRLLEMAAFIIRKLHERAGLAPDVAVCAACGHQAPCGDGNEAMLAHVRQCPKHPLRAELDALRARVAELEERYI